MFDVAESLRVAFERAGDALNEAQRAVARANAGEAAGRRADAAMAQSAQAAIFTEALIRATRARLEEFKAVTK